MAELISQAQSRLMTMAEVAERLRRSQAQLRWMRHNRSGPPSALIAGRVMYREDELEAWIDAQFAADTKAAS